MNILQQMNLMFAIFLQIGENKKVTDEEMAGVSRACRNSRININSINFTCFIGPKKLPELGKAFGQTFKEFKNSSKSEKEDEKENNR